MFITLSNEARECRLYAEHCADRARLQSDPQLRKDYLEMQRRWLALAAAMSSQSSLNFCRLLKQGIKKPRRIFEDGRQAPSPIPACRRR